MLVTGSRAAAYTVARQGAQVISSKLNYWSILGSGPHASGRNGRYVPRFWRLVPLPGPEKYAWSFRIR